MALHTNIEISIGSQTITVIDQFQLIEKAGEHTTFSIVIEGEHFTNGDDDTTNLLEKSKAYLGEECTIRIGDYDDAPTNQIFQFKGVITNLEGFRDTTDAEVREMVEITGMSGSIVLEGGADTNSSSEMPLSEIVTNTLGNYNRSILNTVISPENDAQLYYSVQHNQSKFSYLQHLAAITGEYLLYAGDTLYFGKPNLGDTINLELVKNLESVKIGLTTLPTKFNYYSNDYFNEDAVSFSTTNAPATSGVGLAGFATQVNEKLFPTETKIGLHTYEDTQLDQRLNTAVALQKKLTEQAQVTLSGSSFIPGVSLGKVIDIQNNDAHYGSYRIVSVKHTCSDSGHYTNNFTAVPIEIDVYPLTDINSVNKSESQTAKVVENVDPDGLSRVKVQFPWQVMTNQTTPWIRMMTPHSGADKGFHFIPEVGENVIVGFEGGNAERPFIMGALYTGINKPEAWQTDANNIKAIRTRSGHTIELNDTKGEEKINIYDNEGSIISFDTQAKSLTINATEDIKMVAKNISIEAQENISIGAQQNVDITAESELKAMSNQALKFQSGSDLSIKSNGNLALEATSDATIKGTNAIIEGSVSAEVNGTQAKLNGKTMTEVAGAVIKLN